MSAAFLPFYVLSVVSCVTPLWRAGRLLSRRPSAIERLRYPFAATCIFASVPFLNMLCTVWLIAAIMREEASK